MALRLDSNKSKIHSESKSQLIRKRSKPDFGWIAINQRYILKANHNRLEDWKEFNDVG